MMDGSGASPYLSSCLRQRGSSRRIWDPYALRCGTPTRTAGRSMRARKVECVGKSVQEKKLVRARRNCLPWGYWIYGKSKNNRHFFLNQIFTSHLISRHQFKRGGGGVPILILSRWGGGWGSERLLVVLIDASRAVNAQTRLREH